MLRPPPDVSLYHRHSNPLFPQTLEHVGSLENVHAFVIPRTEEQRDYVSSLALPSVIVPDEAVDAQSLIAFADLVVSAGGTMNREAAALGVPVYTTYGGRLGGVDEELIREGRLRPLTDPRALELQKRDRGRDARGAATRRSCSTCCSRRSTPLTPDRRRARDPSTSTVRVDDVTATIECSGPCRWRPSWARRPRLPRRAMTAASRGRAGCTASSARAHPPRARAPKR